MSTDAWKKLSKGEWKKWLGVVGRMLLAYALVFSQGALAGQNEQAKDKPAGSQKIAAQNPAAQPKASATAPTKASVEAEESEGTVAEKRGPDDPAHQGIKVHGHWIIDVRNPDGTLVAHREFENSLVIQGAAFLAAALSGTQTQGPWVVMLDDNSTIGGPCLRPVNSGGPPPVNVGGGFVFGVGAFTCLIDDNRLPDPKSPGIFPTLNVTATNPNLSQQLILTGSATAERNGIVSNVNTINLTCAPTTTTSACVSGTGIPAAVNAVSTFTGATTQTLQVSTGQTIAVTVTLSFS